MLSRPQMNRVKRLFLYPSPTSLKITVSSGLPTGWHVLSPLFSVSKWSGKNLLWKSLSLVQTVFTELCQGVMKWAIISLHQRVRFHKVHALINGLLPLKQGSESPLSLLGSGLHLMPALLFLWQFNEPIQRSQPTENGSFFFLFFYSLWDEPAHTGGTAFTTCSHEPGRCLGWDASWWERRGRSAQHTITSAAASR